jgi:hypothetical protein
MIPAVFIYALFPKERIGVSGPLGGLTINATGAFAAYVITFFLAYPIVQQAEKTFAGMVHPIWKVSAKVKLVDENGQEVDPDWLKGLLVELRPDFYATANEIVNVSVPEINGKLPNLVLRIPGFGSKVIDTSDDKLSRDEYNKELKVQEPVLIKKFPVLSGGIAKSAAQGQ